MCHSRLFVPYIDNKHIGLKNGDEYIVWIYHFSEIRGLCFMKLSSETLQNLPYFWNMKTHFFFRFSFQATLGIFKQFRHSSKYPLLLKPRCCLKCETKKIFGLSSSKNMAKFWNASLDNFIQHKPHISEECYQNSYKPSPSRRKIPKNKLIWGTFSIFCTFFSPLYCEYFGWKLSWKKAMHIFFRCQRPKYENVF